jgi:hypothetical protein
MNLFITFCFEGEERLKLKLGGILKKAYPDMYGARASKIYTEPTASRKKALYDIFSFFVATLMKEAVGLVLRYHKKANHPSTLQPADII